jgi:adenosylcobinamide-GDP ribazoletransferase
VRLLPDPLRLMLGTLTILPVRPPSTITRRTAGHAMLLAPLGGALLAVPVWALGHLDQPLLAAALAVSALAIGSRAIHLDGLADVADGLGSRAPAERALQIMKQSDIGPFGVVALVLNLLVQVAALAELFARDDEWAAVVAVMVSRSILPWLCTWPAARADGLGATMAQSVTWPAANASIVGFNSLVGVGLIYSGVDVESASAAIAGLWVGWLFGRYCLRRFGGTTGDVYGACVELTLTGSLLAAVLA